MIAHQAIVVNGNLEAFSIKAHEFFKMIIISRLFIDNPLFDTSIDDMVYAGQFYAGFARHTLFLQQSITQKY